MLVGFEFVNNLKQVIVEGIVLVVVEILVYWRCYDCRMIVKDSGRVGQSLFDFI